MIKKVQIMSQQKYTRQIPSYDFICERERAIRSRNNRNNDATSTWNAASCNVSQTPRAFFEFGAIAAVARFDSVGVAPDAAVTSVARRAAGAAVRVARCVTTFSLANTVALAPLCALVVRAANSRSSSCAASAATSSSDDTTPSLVRRSSSKSGAGAAVVAIAVTASTVDVAAFFAADALASRRRCSRMSARTHDAGMSRSIRGNADRVGVVPVGAVWRISPANAALACLRNQTLVSTHTRRSTCAQLHAGEVPNTGALEAGTCCRARSVRRRRVVNRLLHHLHRSLLSETSRCRHAVLPL
jgi:hypothetical protein